MRTDLLYGAAIRAYGEEAQKRMAIEECSELINALCKEPRKRADNAAVITEIADVAIMCGQLALMYGEAAVRAEIARKQERLLQRLHDGGHLTQEEWMSI